MPSLLAIMFSNFGIVALLSPYLVASTIATTHKAFVGREGAPDVIYTLEFDDVALTLELAANASMPVPPGFLALSVRTLSNSSMPNMTVCRADRQLRSG